MLSKAGRTKRKSRLWPVSESSIRFMQKVKGVAGASTQEKMMMVGRTSTNILLAGFCAFALCGCTRNNQLMIRPSDGVLTYCSPLNTKSLRTIPDEHCLGALEAVGFTEAENVALAGGGGFYLSDDGRVLSSEELIALSPHSPPPNNSFPTKSSGLKAGDAIIAVNGVTVKTRSEIVPHLIGKPGQKVTVRIRRNNIEQDVIMAFKPYLESDGDIFYDGDFFFHLEYTYQIVPGLNGLH